MQTSGNDAYKNSRNVNRWVYVTVLLANLLVFVCIGAVYVASSRNYSQKLADEHIENVNSLNAASANAAHTYTNSMDMKLDDLVSYIKANNLNVNETIRYLGQSNTNTDMQLQLVRCATLGEGGEIRYGDYSGVSLRKVRSNKVLSTVSAPIVYGNGYYEILRSFTDLYDDKFSHSFTPEFTDPATKSKCFAVYHHLLLIDATGQRRIYALLLLVDSQKALEAYNMQNQYKEQSAVLINEHGNYIIKNDDYRNANFFDYIVNYNGLTLDWNKKLQEEVSASRRNGKNVVDLFYNNYRGEACVFAVTPMNNGWYSVTGVPLSSFNIKVTDINYALIILLLFLALFVVDAVAIYYMGKVLKHNIAVAELATSEANEANAAKSLFLSTMSHELRTPLNAIIGFVSLSLKSLGDQSVLGDYLHKIEISSKLLLQLISDILDVSAIESDKMKLLNGEFALEKLITSLSAIFYDQSAEKGIAFSVELKNIHSETLIGDSVRVNQVLLNLLSNALKYTPQGGSITLKVETLKREDNRVEVCFHVVDTGCGISEELKKRLFKPFERSESQTRSSGTGLGLFIAKNLLDLMSGTISVESREGFGSDFCVSIPFGVPVKTKRKMYSGIAGLRVLAVINDAIEREHIGQVLGNIGVEHALTKSVAEAMSLLHERKDGVNAFNLCILDWKLSDLNALDATKSIRSEFEASAMRIMVLAYDIAAANEECVKAGADKVFAKPVFSSSLYNALEEMTGHQLPKKASDISSNELKGKKVLLVDDNRMNTEVAKLILEKFGLVVSTAEDGSIACECFAASEPGYYDVILMDVQMPVMNGYQASSTIRAMQRSDSKTVPILALTADVFLEDVEKAQRAEMNEHISKPIDPDNLFLVLKKYLA